MGTPLLVDPSGRAIKSEADVVELTEQGIVVLSHFHIIAQKMNWSIRCEQCGQPIQGYNSENDKFLSVRCGCREYRGEVTASARRRLG